MGLCADDRFCCDLGRVSLCILPVMSSTGVFLHFYGEFLRIKSPLRITWFNRCHFFPTLYLMSCHLILGILGYWKCGESSFPCKCWELLWLVLTSVVCGDFLWYPMSGEAALHKLNHPIGLSFLELLSFWLQCILIYNDDIYCLSQTNRQIHDVDVKWYVSKGLFGFDRRNLEYSLHFLTICLMLLVMFGQNKHYQALLLHFLILVCPPWMRFSISLVSTVAIAILLVDLPFISRPSMNVILGWSFQHGSTIEIHLNFWVGHPLQMCTIRICKVFSCWVCILISSRSLVDTGIFVLIRFTWIISSFSGN